MSTNLHADEDFGLSSDDEGAMISLLDDQNSGIKRKLDSDNAPPAKRAVTGPTFSCAVSNRILYFYL